MPATAPFSSRRILPYPAGLSKVVGQQRQGRAGRAVTLDERPQRLRAKAGDVAIEDQHVAREAGELRHRGAHRVARAALLALQGIADESLDIAAADVRLADAPDLASLVADDDRDPLRLERQRGVEDRDDERGARDRVQDLGALRAHSGSAPGGENHDGQGARRELRGHSSSFTTDRPRFPP